MSRFSPTSPVVCPIAGAAIGGSAVDAAGPHMTSALDVPARRGPSCSDPPRHRLRWRLIPMPTGSTAPPASA